MVNMPGFFGFFFVSIGWLGRPDSCTDVEHAGFFLGVSVRLALLVRKKDWNSSRLLFNQLRNFVLLACSGVFGWLCGMQLGRCWCSDSACEST